MPDFIEGIINLRGKVIPIINLDVKFHLGQPRNLDTSKIIITTVNEQSIGFVVDNVIEILRITNEHLEEAPDLIKKWGNKYIKCVANIKDKLVNVLDLENILTDEQKEHISSIDQVEE
jgi:purine-binding chemotaxis protein CheW